jgi:hypothetical protein
MRDYGNYKRFIFDNKLKPLEAQLNQGSDAALNKIHLYISTPQKEINPIDEIELKDSIRNYKFKGQSILVENIKDTIYTW